MAHSKELLLLVTVFYHTQLLNSLLLNVAGRLYLIHHMLHCHMLGHVSRDLCNVSRDLCNVSRDYYDYLGVIEE